MQKISIFGPITPDTLTDIQRQIEFLDRNQPLSLDLNSDGGTVSDGVSIYNLFRGWPGGLTVDVVGWALSVASVILQAGSKRRAHDSALIMVHAPWTSATGNAGSMRESAVLLDQVSETLLKIYRVTGQPEAVIRSWLDGSDHWFTASEALALGLVDEVLTDEATQPATPANAFAARHPIPPAFSKMIQAMNTPTTQDIQSIQAAAIKADGVRRAEIRQSFNKFADREGVSAVQASCENDPSCTAAQAGQKLLAHLGSQSSPISGHWNVNTNAGGSRLADYKAAAQDVLLARAGIKVAEPHPCARDLQQASLTTMAASMLSMAGINPRDTSSSGVISAAMGTDDFSLLLGNIANKAMTLGYNEAPSGHALFTGERDVADFKKNTLVNLSEAPSLEKVAELAEYRNGSLLDGAETFQLATFGKILQISRQALINDDLQAFTNLPNAMGAAARRLEADKVFGLLTSNPVLGDSFALFSEEHGNLGSGPLNVTALSFARSKMRLQKGLAGVSFIDPQPKFLIVPVALETIAEQILASLVDPSRNNATPNSDFIRGLTLIADPRLDAVSSTAWYLAASPRQIDGILRAYLSGQPRPYLEENTEFRKDSISYKVRLDFAAGVMDYRGLYKSTGL